MENLIIYVSSPNENDVMICVTIDGVWIGE
jgi:hypothetical protein